MAVQQIRAYYDVYLLFIYYFYSIPPFFSQLFTCIVSMQQLVANQRVKHKFDRKGKDSLFYYGNIDEVNDDGTYNVKFDDKTTEKNMAREELIIVKSRSTDAEENAETKKETSSTYNLNTMREKIKICPAKPKSWSCLECWLHFHDDAGKERPSRPHITKLKGNKVTFIFCIFFCPLFTFS